jgi:hypothetical protein
MSNEVNDHPHARGHHHDHGRLFHNQGWWSHLAAIFHLHEHDQHHGELASDQAFIDNEDGIRTVWLAAPQLAVTHMALPEPKTSPASSSFSQLLLVPE